MICAVLIISIAIKLQLCLSECYYYFIARREQEGLKCLLFFTNPRQTAGDTIAYVARESRISDIQSKLMTLHYVYRQKGLASDPGNLRPITLQHICLKVLTSILRNRLFEFVKNNNYIECCIQNGFVPKMSGTFEHTALLAHLIREAKLKQKSIVITLLDLKNSFGEVQHNLIHTILKYHHVPDSFTSIVKNLYDGFHTSITTKDYATPFLRIEKEVLQGDCLSPLLFNLCMNSFIQFIKTREFEQLSYRSSKLLMPRHWLQFADDAVAVSATEFECVPQMV